VKAIILAAGVGRRLETRLAGRPKCLLAVGGQTLLARLLDALAAAAVREAVVVVGHGADAVREAIGASRAGMPVRYAFNPDYRKGAILSLWCAREELDDDVLVMDADVLCPPALIVRLVRSPHATCFLLDGSVTPSGEEQILMARAGRVYDIAKTRSVPSSYDTFGESVGFLKVARADAPILRSALEVAIAAGRDDIEHEQVFPELMRRCAIGYERIDGVPWIEIDFPEDVERAEREVLPRLADADV
jgi:choline kinase